MSLPLLYTFSLLSTKRYFLRFSNETPHFVGIPMGTNCASLLLIGFYFAIRETAQSRSQRKKRNGAFHAFMLFMFIAYLLLSIQLLDTSSIYLVSI